jgi:hypothetical protein
MVSVVHTITASKIALSCAELFFRCEVCTRMLYAFHSVSLVMNFPILTKPALKGCGDGIKNASARKQIDVTMQCIGLLWE